MKRYLLFLLCGFAVIAKGQQDTSHLGFYTNGYQKKVSAVHPNGNSSLGQSYLQQNICGLNYVTASVMTATRYHLAPHTYAAGTGFPTTLSVSGLPACYTVQKAFLYWTAAYQEATAPATSAILTNTVPAVNTIASTLVGTSAACIWGETGTATYRTDVSTYISGNGTYTLDISGFSNKNWEVDGVTLIIVYAAPATYSGSIAIYDGCMASAINGLNMVDTLNGFNVCATSVNANGFGAYGDCQSNVSGNQNTDIFNGNTQSFPNDFWNFNVIPITLTTGQTQAIFKSYTNNGSDAWNWNIAGLYWQDTNCVACTITTLPSNAVPTNATCGYNGSITVNVSGGTLPYTYSWSPSVSSSNTATGLSGGTYTILVTDANCSVAHDTTIVLGSTFSVSSTHTNVSCNAGNNGSIAINATGGIGTYTYSWLPSGGNTSALTGLTAGTYTSTVMDSNGCSATTAVTITQPTAIAFGPTATGTSCNGGNNGTASANASGGTNPFTYSWNTSPVQTNATATGLSAGTYTCTITDANGCRTTATTTVTEPAAITGGFINDNSLCNQANGASAINVSGGTGPYTYRWSTSPAQTNARATGLTAGTYSVTVTDSNHCNTTFTTTVLNSVFLPGVTACCDTTISPGQFVTLSVDPATFGNTYAWTPVAGLSCTTCPNPVVTPTATTTYTVIITNTFGCTSVQTVTVKIDTPCTDFVVPNIFTPNNDGIDDDFVVRVTNPSTFNINIYDRWGKLVYTSTNPTSYWNGRYNGTENLVPDGTYYYTISTNCGSKAYNKKGFVQVVGEK